jgi:hypothetical protein
VCVAVNLDNNSIEPHKNVERFLTKIGPTLDLLCRADKKSIEQSENMSSVSRTERSTPAYAKVFNSKLWKVLSQLGTTTQKIKTEDFTITLKKFLQYLKVSNIFVEADCALL